MSVAQLMCERCGGSVTVEPIESWPHLLHQFFLFHLQCWHAKRRRKRKPKK